MRGVRQLSVLAAAISVGALFAGPAAADEIPSESAIAGYEVGPTITTRETTMDIPNATGIPAPSKCKTQENTISGKNSLGQKLWTFHQKVRWCYNGSKVTHAESSGWATGLALGWTYKGVQSTETRGGAGQSAYHVKRTGKFCLVPYVSCAQEAYPWISHSATKSGTIGWSRGY
ncbi:hypothetical protein [Nonomuraea sp. JJY05]|uniref:hypothetical protein n=1 Tax=Nonomuraea sp. JJY05 TaxID=3350255 RepID=UPI00373F6195